MRKNNRKKTASDGAVVNGVKNTVVNGERRSKSRIYAATMIDLKQRVTVWWATVVRAVENDKQSRWVSMKC
jgi:hypothetical protein